MDHHEKSEMLERTWVVHYNGTKTNNLHQSGHEYDWGSEIRKVGSFDSIKTFWQYFNNLTNPRYIQFV